MEGRFAEPLPAGREVQLPTNAKPHSAVCKYFHTPKVCYPSKYAQSTSSSLLSPPMFLSLAFAVVGMPLQP